MPDEGATQNPEAVVGSSTVDLGNGNGDGGGENPEIARERKRANDAYALLRRSNASISELQERLNKLEADRTVPPAAAAQPAAREPGLNDPDPEPNRASDPVEWLAWCRREDRREAARNQARNEMESLNTFAVSSEQIARQQIPDYDQAIGYLRSDYRKELEDSGELYVTALDMLAASQNDPNGRAAITNRMAEKGLSEIEAAQDLCADAAFEWRRQRIVKAQRMKGGNPAVEAVNMAKRRGYKTVAAGGAAQATGTGDALDELTRRQNLRRGTETIGDIRDAGEPREKRAWNRAQLDELQQSNPKEWRRVIKEIAAAADEQGAASVLPAIITR